MRLQTRITVEVPDDFPEERLDMLLDRIDDELSAIDSLAYKVAAQGFEEIQIKISEWS